MALPYNCEDSFMKKCLKFSPVFVDIWIFFFSVGRYIWLNIWVKLLCVSHVHLTSLIRVIEFILPWFDGFAQIFWFKTYVPTQPLIEFVSYLS